MTHSDDEDVVVVAVEKTHLTDQQLRIQLISYLISCPPPMPITWTSFKYYIETKCGTYYSEDVMEYVYKRLEKSMPTTTVINIDSDSESEDNKNISTKLDCVKSKTKEAQTSPIGFNETNQHNKISEEKDRLEYKFSKKELFNVRMDPGVKKHSHYIKEIYKLIKDIQDSSSCKICIKLKDRIVKFRDLLGSESPAIQKKVNECINSETNNYSENQSENIIDSQITNKNSPKTSKIKNGSNCTTAKADSGDEKSTKQKNSKRKSKDSIGSGQKCIPRAKSKSLADMNVLSEAEADKIRENLLLDKLIEISLPDIVKAVQLGKVAPKAITKTRRTRKSLSNSESNHPNNSPCLEETKVPIEPDSTEIVEPVTNRRSPSKEKSPTKTTKLNSIAKKKKSRGSELNNDNTTKDTPVTPPISSTDSIGNEELNLKTKTSPRTSKRALSDKRNDDVKTKKRKTKCVLLANL